MKLLKKTIAFLVLTLPLLSSAQDEKTNYLFSGKDGEVVVGGFGGPMVYFGEFNGDFAVMTGGGGAAILNRRFFIGGYGMGVATQHQITEVQSNDFFSLTYNYDIEYGHGGLWTGFIFNPAQAIHFTTGLKVGGGYLSYDQIEEDPIERDIDGFPFFILTPEAGIELNLLPFMKMGASIGYQYTPGNRQSPVSNEQINSFMGGITFKFGWFGDK